jgi:hypothetical protein
MRTRVRWADYSAGRPSAAALKAAGFGGVIRYVGLGKADKRITAAEYQDMVANGVQVLLVAELDSTDAWEAADDYANGVSHAGMALADARALGIPDSVGIAAAADAHATASQVADAVNYCRGFRDVLGLARTGFYGFRETLTAVHDAGMASWFWRCGSQPTAAERQWTHFWQRNDGTTTVSGIAVDINEQYNDIPEDDVSFSDVIGHRKDGSAITAGDALVNLYLGAYYGGGDAGTHPVFPTVSALATQLGALQGSLAATIEPVVQTAVTNALGTGQSGIAQKIADQVVAELTTSPPAR